MSADAVLKFFWWLALGLTVATIGVMLVGQLGLSLLLRHLGRHETEREALVARSGWSGVGHPAWLLLVGGAVVGAWWPLFHATLFAGLWPVLVAVAVALAVAPVGHGCRGHISPRWRAGWDMLWAAIALAALLLMGIGVGVTVSGAPFSFDAHLNAHWSEFASRFSVYEVLVPGLFAPVFAVLLAASRAAAGAPDEVVERARLVLLGAGVLALLLFAGGAVWATQLPGYAVGGMPAMGGPLTPLDGTTFAVPGAYLNRFLFHLSRLIIPVITGLLFLGVLVSAWQAALSRAWRLAALAVVGMVATAGTMTYPVIVPSWSVPAQSLTVWNAAATEPVLIALLVWLGVLVPAVAAYEVWLRSRAPHVVPTWNGDAAR